MDKHLRSVPYASTEVEKVAVAKERKFSVDYQPNFFYCSYKDGDGGTTNLGQVRVQVTMHSAVKAVMEYAGKDVYRSAGDFARDALYHRLAWWEQNSDSPELQEQLEAFRRQTEMMDRIDARERVREYWAKIFKSFDRAIAEGDFEEAIEMLVQMQGLVASDAPKVLRERAELYLTQSSNLLPKEQPADAE